MKPTAHTAEHAVREIIARHTGTPVQDVSLTTRLDDLDLDSLEVISVIMDCEKLFDVDIPDDQLQRMERAQDIIKFVEDQDAKAARC